MSSRALQLAIGEAWASTASQRGLASSLVITGVDSSTSISITADEAVLESAAGVMLVQRNVNVALGLMASGVGGIDTGALTASTWYAIYLISNGATLSAVYSTNFSAPVLSSGYTYYARVGFFQASPFANSVMGFMQRGKIWRYVPATGSGILPQLPNISSGQVGTWSTTAPVWLTKSILPWIPNLAVTQAISLLNGNSNTTATSTMIASNSSYGGFASANPPPLYQGTPSGTSAGQVFDMVLESSNIYLCTQGANSLIRSAGFVLL